VPKKNGKIRIVVDARQLNKAILRKRHKTPTIDDLIFKLNGATVFFKADLNNGYRQIELHPDSRFVTTFRTHKSLFPDKRLNIGYCSAAEMFNS